MYKIFLNIVLISLNLVCLTVSTELLNREPDENILELAVSAKTQSVEIVWYDLELKQNGTIYLTNTPLNDINFETLFNVTPRETNGWITTDIYYNYSYFQKEIDINTGCYGFWAYYLNNWNGEIYEATCMQPYSRWMNQIREHIQDLKFREIFIPGAHDSAAYKLNFDPAEDDTIVTKYALTQDEDITGQLLHGIRYLDIRPAYQRYLKPQFWINHGAVPLHPMDQVLKDVYNFVQKTNEIVILDFHQFPWGFNSDDIHHDLVKFVNETIGDQIIDLENVWHSTLKEIWSQPKRIILGYNIGNIQSNYHPFTWKGISHRWADTDKKETLKNYLYRINDDPAYSSTPVSDMAELTPTASGIVIDLYKGLRKMADNVNRDVSLWYWEDLGQKANIVSLDFFRGTTIVQNAIYVNKHRKNVISRNKYVWNPFGYYYNIFDRLSSQRS